MENSEDTGITPARAIAIVGMAGRFPGAATADEFWENLANGVEALTQFSDEHLLARGIASALVANPAYVKQAPVLADHDMFDATFFGFTPRQAEITDPQLRIFLETAHAALEDAGYRPRETDGLVGVYAGSAISSYMLNNLLRSDEASRLGQMAVIMANDKDYIATMTSYKLNLKGPSVSVNTACSTSLVAIHLARMALLNYECDMALAGGVRVTAPQDVGYLYQEGGISSPDGHCRAFDARAAGTTGGSGAGVVVLKRMEDALTAGDNIYAVIRGSAINNDGADRVGFSAPGVNGQIAVIEEAHAVAEVDPAEVSYVEAHGTGTAMGDPIEIDALTQAFGSGETGYCGIGSLKTNVGHLDTAAGVASVIKVAQALRHRRLPPTLNYETPNPKIDFARSPFFVNDRLRDWQPRRGKRIAGINGFGIGGTNAHLVLEQAPTRNNDDRGRPCQVLALSAKSEAALDQAAANLAAHLRARPDLNLADVAYTLQVGREAYAHRLAVTCADAEQGARMLEGGPGSKSHLTAGVPKLCFIFPGQGAQHLDMARELYAQEPEFRRAFDHCAGLCASLGADLRDVLIHQPEDRAAADAWLCQTRHAQPALFVVEYAVARMLMAWGLVPSAMVGHSIGEYVAACLSGVFDLETALMLVATRGRCMQQAEAGAMLAVLASEQEIGAYLPATCDLAAVNGPSHCVVAGPDGAIDALAAKLNVAGIGCRRLQTSHAFHSRSMEPVLGIFEQAFQGVAYGGPAIPFVSSLSGTWANAEEVCTPRYWMRHLREPVRFAESVRTLLEDPQAVLVEVGPGTSLTKLARQQAGRRTVVATLPGMGDRLGASQALMQALGELWSAGASIQWEAFTAGQTRHRVSLPTYPFQRLRYWLEGSHALVPAALPGKRGDASGWLYAPTWQREPGILPGDWLSASAVGERWLIVGGEHPLAHIVKARLVTSGCMVTLATTGPQYQSLPNGDFQLRPSSADDMGAMLGELKTKQMRPQRILHLRALDGCPGSPEELDGPFYSLLHLARAWVRHFPAGPVKLVTVGQGVHLVLGSERLHPVNATALGPAKVLAQEHGDIRCKHVDVDPVWTAMDSAQEHGIELLLSEFDRAFDAMPVAHRCGGRWTQSWSSIQAPSQAPASVLRAQGCYLITGGLGGIGLALAGYLARRYQGKLVLLGRTPLPERDAWVQLQASPETGRTLRECLAQLEAIEAAGAKVLVQTADVTDSAQVRRALDHAESAFGPIHGVFHAAGLPGSGIVALGNDEQAASVLRPKIRGTDVLMDALVGRPAPDFVVLFSSLNALLGGAGQADYAAANAYLDASAHAYQCELGIRTQAVNWDGWQEAGMLARALDQTGGARAEMEALGLTNAEALRALEAALATGLPQTAVSTFSLEVRLAGAGKAASVDQRGTVPEGAPSTAVRGPRPTLDTPFVAPTTDLQRRIAAIWSDLLGVGEIGIADDFFQLGGDSLLVMQLNARLRSLVTLDFPLQSLFENPTIAALADYLEQMQQQETREDQALTALMAELASAGVQ